MEMVTVTEAEQAVLSEARDFGTELAPLEHAPGRTLAEDILADRDLPPGNRATMDGIAIRYAAFAAGRRTFRIAAVLAAGVPPVDIDADDQCAEIMTGGAVPGSADTVIRYEDVELAGGWATVTAAAVTKGQSIHLKGRDKKAGEVVIAAPVVINPALISLAASVGKPHLVVKRLPRVAVVSTGSELADIGEPVTPYQVRRSNAYTIRAVLQQYALQPTLLHIPDDPGATRREVERCLAEYDVLLLTGGVSMGKFDYVPRALEEAGVQQLFHRVRQRPGKPFWFGKRGQALVFAFPGNPVSTFLCLHRYFVPWLRRCQALPPAPQINAVLAADYASAIPLHVFLQVRLALSERGQLMATPAEGHGSGDYANLVTTDGFMELPPGPRVFSTGEVYPVWKW